jgi:glucose-6-phosphate 1-dehydrogenase
VQNIMLMRFANGIFEPLWNRNYINHVEITAAESLGVEKRGGYYETSGALRDMVQNHLLQVAAITAMESPSSLEPIAIRNEVLKVFQSLRPILSKDVKKLLKITEEICKEKIQKFV